MSEQWSLAIARRALAMGALLSVSLAAGSARATDGLYLHAYGARSAGMGGATLASGDDALAQIDNPANLSASPKEIDLGLAYLRTDVNFENSGTYGPGVTGLAGTSFSNDADAATDFAYFPLSDNNHFAPLGAGVYRFDESDKHLGPLRLRNLSFGLAGNVIGGDAVRFRLDHPVFGPDTLYRDNLVVGGASGTLAYRVNDWLSVGGALQVVGGRWELDQPSAFQVSDVAKGTNPFLPVFGVSNFGEFLQAMGVEEGWAFTRFNPPGLTLGVGGRFGATLRPTSWLQLAVTYQTRRNLCFEGTAELQFDAQINELQQIVIQNPENLPFVTNLQNLVKFVGGDLSPESVQEAFRFLGFDSSLGFDQYYDTQVRISLPRQVSLGIAVAPTHRLLVEFDYDWIQWSKVFEEVSFSFSNGSNPNINDLTGGTSATFALPLDWKDQHVFRLGARYALTPRLAVRLGYSYATHPIRSEGHILTIPVAGFQTISAGLSYWITHHVETTLALERSLPRTIRVGPSNISSFEANSEETMSEWVAQAQLRIGF